MSTTIGHELNSASCLHLARALGSVRDLPEYPEAIGYL
jgi:hypothetical protein